jgi:hypothetical protein
MAARYRGALLESNTSLVAGLGTNGSPTVVGNLNIVLSCRSGKKKIGISGNFCCREKGTQKKFDAHGRLAPL